MVKINIGKFSKELTKLVDERYPRTVAAVYLFGSYAKGYARPDSDVDIAVLYREGVSDTDEEGANTLIICAAEGFFPMQTEIRPTEVSLAVLNRAQLLLRLNVINDGLVLYDGMPEERHGFEYRTVTEYEDEHQYMDEAIAAAFIQVSERGLQ